MKKLLCVFLVLLLTAAICPWAIPSASAGEKVDFLRWKLYDGVPRLEEVYVENAYVIDSDTFRWPTGWYVVKGKVTISVRVTVAGDVGLILADGCELTCEEGIEVEKGILYDSELEIFAQSEGSNMGKLIATGNKDRAGIGSGYCVNPFTGDITGDITIHGGHIEATGGEDAAGIGGGDSANGGKLIIYSGEVIAGGGYRGAGIGGGVESVDRAGGDGGNVTVYNGKVSANGGYRGAGIGGGVDGDGGNVTIYDGVVTAKGNTGGAGIGGGDKGDGGSVVIRKGTVTATGDSGGAGIGGGDKGKAGTVAIYDGTVTARGYEGGAGIGGGSFGDGGKVTVSGGTVKAEGHMYGAGIGGGSEGKGGEVTLNGGTFEIKAGFDAAVIGAGSLGGSNGSIAVKTGLFVIDSDGSRVNGGFNPKSWSGLSYFTEDGRRKFTIATNGSPVPYLGYDPRYGMKEHDCKTYTYITKDIKQWKDGWYVVDDSGTFNDTVTVTGDVHLIIEDGKTLTAAKGIRVEKDATLSIYAQSEGNDRGSLVANGTLNCAAIGGRSSKSGGTVTVHSGNVTANGGENAAGVGGGYRGKGGAVTLYGGTLTATAGMFAPRAVGAGVGIIGDGSFAVRPGYTLYDLDKKEVIQKDPGKSWIETLSASRVSVTPVKEKEPDQPEVSYLYYNENGNPVSAKTKKYFVLDKNINVLEDGWYVVKESLNLGPLSALGNVRLILMDGVTLTVDGGVCVNEGSSLTIYAQSEDINTMGQLNASAAGTECAGIGANGAPAGDITIHGGRIKARGGVFSAGIGGSDHTGCGNIRIYGGHVQALSPHAAGIGSGRYPASVGKYGHNGNITISGGTVIAMGGRMSAGIGGGEGFDAGTITISGGEVKAESDKGSGGCGIGSGRYKSLFGSTVVPGGTVKIVAGEVTATAGADNGAIEAKDVIIRNDAKVTVYKGNKPIAVTDPSKFASECRAKSKAVIKAGSVAPVTGDNSRTLLWTALMAVSLIGAVLCVTLGKKKRNAEE